LTPNERVLTFGVPVYGVKFHQNGVRFATVGEVTDRRTDRQTHRQTDTGDFIICPMLCYSNGTDNETLLTPAWGMLEHTDYTTVRDRMIF